MTKTKVKRHYTNEEHFVRRSWGMRWDLMLKEIRRHGATAILVGYHFQPLPRLVHAEHIPWNMTGLMRLQMIVLKDGSKILLEIRKVTVEKILLQRLVRVNDSEDLINEARSLMQPIYHVEGGYVPTERQKEYPLEVPWWNRD